MGCTASVQVMPYSTVPVFDSTSGIASSKEVRFQVK